MNISIDGELFSKNAAENYQQYFVPAIGAPVADNLIAAADLQPGESVLDVACGTGIATRMAAALVGETGSTIGLDVNECMLSVARKSTPTKLPIVWKEADAQSLPYENGEFDKVLCQMGLQFVSDKSAVLKEMRRVLKSNGRAVISVPGPIPPMFAILAQGLARHFGAEAASFCELVFSLHDPSQLRALAQNAGFSNVEVRSEERQLRLPRPPQFLWQYIHSTPLAKIAANTDKQIRQQLETEICGRWSEFVVADGLCLAVNMTTLTGGNPD